MKRFPLLSLVALVLAVVYGCSDSTAPASSNALLVHTNPAHDFLGDPPPPPVDAAITITISSHPASGAFSGVYFNEGKTAWLRLDNAQPDAFGTSASANARFKASGDRFSGMGTLMIEGQEVVINAVTSFVANPSCGVRGEPCAFITFDATVDGEPGHRGTAEAFDRSTCTFVPFEGGGGFFNCGGE